MKSLNKLMRGNKGATAVEYAIIAAVLALVAGVGFGTVGTNINTGMGVVAGQVDGN